MDVRERAGILLVRYKYLVRSLAFPGFRSNTSGDDILGRASNKVVIEHGLGRRERTGTVLGIRSRRSAASNN